MAIPVFFRLIGPTWADSSGPVVIYGTGSAATQLLDNHGSELGIRLFASTEGGGTFEGQTIMSAREAAALPDARIIIASSFIEPIFKLLTSTGITNDRLWWYRADRDSFIPGSAIYLPPETAKVLYAVFDLERHRTLQDAAAFAVLAEAARRRRGLNAISFIIQPAKLAYDRIGRLGEFAVIATAVFGLLASAKGCVRLACREDVLGMQAAAWLPEEENACIPERPLLAHFYREANVGPDMRCLAAPEAAKSLVAAFLSRRLAGRRLITLSLREFPGEPDRSAMLGRWIDFLAGLPSDKYFVVLLRHADCAYEPLPAGLTDYADFPQASADIACRMALYEAAALNLMDYQDSAALLLFSAKARYLIQKPHLPIGVGNDRDELTSRYGFAVGGNFPLAGEGQAILWDPAKLQSIFDAAMGEEPKPVATTVSIPVSSLDTWFPDDDLSLEYALASGIYERHCDVPIVKTGEGLPWQEMLDDPECGVFLTLGQSNGANEGQTRYEPRGSVFSLSFADMCCRVAHDPLSGATGLGGSPWSRLGDLLIDAGLYRRVLFLPAARSGSCSADWMPGGYCFRRLALLTHRLRRVTGRRRLPVNAILWTQGEADANLTAMPAESYRLNFFELVDSMHEMGLDAPVVIGKTTPGESAPSYTAIRQAFDLILATHPNVLPGPDLDLIGADMRFDGCHFSHQGLQRAAEAWLDVLMAHHSLIVSKVRRPASA